VSELTPEQKADNDRIHSAIQASDTLSDDVSDDLRGAVLVGWGCVAEWMSTDGERWLSKMAMDGCPTWQVKGYHHEVLYGDWPE
jgi:hypothetical protein